MDSDIHDPDDNEDRRKVFARLAVLQRLRDEAKSCNRHAMLHSIEMLMRNELHSLQDGDEGSRRA